MTARVLFECSQCGEDVTNGDFYRDTLSELCGFCAREDSDAWELQPDGVPPGWCDEDSW